ncbi:helix-turn-helix transcriptional regulator [Streptomyces sp. NPDC052101]|uniref:helix-turn-helix domain-containing protein n=1 Tax=Streptomyces sp. NPDC052101 TaxID=3155763 RepID=UPI003428B24E
MGEQICQARVLQRRSQHEVAASLGYHQSKVSRLESGRGTEDIRVLCAIAQELNIPPDQLGLASSLRVQAHVLVREKHTTEAVALVRHTADQLTGSYDRRSLKYQDIRRPDVRNLVADMAARDRRRTLPELHHFSRRPGVPA